MVFKSVMIDDDKVNKPRDGLWIEVYEHIEFKSHIHKLT